MGSVCTFWNTITTLGLLSCPTYSFHTYLLSVNYTLDTTPRARETEVNYTSMIPALLEGKQTQMVSKEISKIIESSKK